MFLVEDGLRPVPVFSSVTLELWFHWIIFTIIKERILTAGIDSIDEFDNCICLCVIKICGL